jgi:hypothetical protein
MCWLATIPAEEGTGGGFEDKDKEKSSGSVAAEAKGGVV